MKYFFLLLLFALALNSCSDEDTITNTSKKEQISVANKNNSFAYNITSSDYYGNTKDTLIFDADSVSIAYNVVNTKGNISFIVKSKTGDVLFTETVSNNKSFGATRKFAHKPTSISITENNFSGVASFAIAGLK